MDEEDEILYDPPEDQEQLGRLPCWVLLQIPSILELLGVAPDFRQSLVGEVVIALCQDAMGIDDADCLTVKEVFKVAELLTGQSAW